MNPYLRIRLIIFSVLAFAFLMSVSGKSVQTTKSKTADFEKRCGWFSNPTPANVSLYDKDAEWIIGVQGGYQVEDDWEWPKFKAGQWVHTNGADYGYGCVCMDLTVNKETHEVLHIKDSRALLLSTCRNDPALKKYKGKL